MSRALSALGDSVDGEDASVRDQRAAVMRRALREKVLDMMSRGEIATVLEEANVLEPLTRRESMFRTRPQQREHYRAN